MLNKELLMDDTQLNVLPYWGTTDYVLERLVHFDSLNTSIFMLDKDSQVTVFVEGYSTSLHNGEVMTGDLYDMRNSEGSTRYLTFDPPLTVTWIQRHTNRSRNRVLCRRSSLGGSRC